MRLDTVNGYAGKVASFYKETTAAQPSVSAPAEQGQKQDVISLSSSAAGFKELRGLSAQIQSELDAERPETKIATLKEQIAAGTYQVDTREVATAILERFA